MTATAIETVGLTKRFGRVLAVDRVSLTVRHGDIYGFLGPNGSGKTTTVRMLLGLVYATSGDMRVLGEPMPKRAAHVLPQVGALVEGPAFWPDLSGRAALSRVDASTRRPGRSLRASRASRIADALRAVGLAGIDKRPVRAYSFGMRQRLGIAAALLRSPRLLVLDEPTNGLDPQGIREIRELLLKLNADGTTIFVSSHQLAEVEALCTRAGIVDSGRLVLEDDMTTLCGPTGRVIVRTPDAAAAADALRSAVVAVAPGSVTVRSADPVDVHARLVRAGVRVAELVVERRTLEDVFLAVTSSGSDRAAGGAP
ncbi:MAG: type transport system ATP-binding protein [Frankiaceae bacterium]|nr:type transport system ATP-binding protein [Frankiaceae bacterium]